MLQGHLKIKCYQVLNLNSSVRSTQEKYCRVWLQMVLDQQKILFFPDLCVGFRLRLWDGGGWFICRGHLLPVCSRPDSSQPELLLLPVRGNVPSSAQPAERRRSWFLSVVRKRRIWDIIKLLVWWEAKSIKVCTNLGTLGRTLVLV